jgi:hypothetical protein
MIYVEVYSCAAAEAKGIGFRFETPESIAGKSMHDYWHVQLTNDSVHGGPWVPDHIPCLPAVAHCPVSLTLYFLRSFYDEKILGKIVSQVNIPKVYLKSLHDRGLLGKRTISSGQVA